MRSADIFTSKPRLFQFVLGIVFVSGLLFSWLAQSLFSPENSRSFTNPQLGVVSSLLCDEALMLVVEGTITWSPSEANPFQNLFQTADLNSGLRAEVRADGLLTLVLPALDGLQPEGLSSLVHLEPGIPHQIKLSYSDSGMASVAINDRTIRRRFSPETISCENMRIGQGFDSSRVFLGPHELTITIFTKGTQSHIVRGATSFLFATICLAATVVLVKSKTSRDVALLLLLTTVLVLVWRMTSKPIRSEVFQHPLPKGARIVEVPNESTVWGHVLKVRLLRESRSNLNESSDLLNDPAGTFSLSCRGSSLRFSRVVLSDSDLLTKSRRLITEIVTTHDLVEMRIRGGSIEVVEGGAKRYFDRELENLRTSFSLHDSPHVLLNGKTACAELASWSVMRSATDVEPFRLLLVLNVLLLTAFVVWFRRRSSVNE